MKTTASIHPVNRPSSGSNVSFKHPVSELEKAKAKAIAQALSGGSKARAVRLEITILDVLCIFGGTVSHVEPPKPAAYPLTDYTPDPEAEPLSAQ